MTNPVALDIAIAITDRIRQITVANGYRTDIGLRVFRGITTIEGLDTPAAVVSEGDDDILASTPSEAKIAQTYSIEGYAEAADPDNPSDTAHFIIADIKKALFGDATFRKTLGLPLGVVKPNGPMTYAGRVIAVRAKGSGLTAGGVQIRVEFGEKLDAP